MVYLLNKLSWIMTPEYLFPAGHVYTNYYSATKYSKDPFSDEKEVSLKVRRALK